MSHTDPTILALLAVGERAGDPGDRQHVTTCSQCRGELARLAEIVELARQAGTIERLEPPPPAVWAQITAAVGNGTALPVAVARRATADGSAGDRKQAEGSEGETGPRARRGARAGWRGSRLAVGLAGLAAGLIIGIGATAGIVHLTRAPAPSVVARIELSPLPQFPQWQDASGTAVMRATASQQVLVVTLQAPQRPGFYEVWLLARNGVSMISLGDLNATHTGTFTVPPGTNLRNYSRIDVSLQPFNGSTLHSKVSVVRGSLPPAAFGAGSGSASPS